MTKGEDFKLLKIQTCVLKVNIHCDGCKHKVKKLLQKIEGVYTVCIDADQQKVTVSGTVDSATLIKKLLRSGKHAELCSQKGNQMRKLQPNCNKDEKSAKEQKMDIFKDLKTQQKFPTFSLDDDVEDDDDEEDDEEEFRFLREKAAKVGLIRQVNEANAKKKNVSNGNSAGGGGGNNGGKKGGNGGNQNQNGILKIPGGVQRTDIAANRDLNIAHNGGGANGGGGFGFQAQPNDFQSSGQQGYGILGYQHPSAMMNNMNMMNMQNMNDRFIQQMMYHNKSPVVPSNITYHPYQSYYYHPYHHPHRHEQSESVEYASHMFSDENTSSCTVM